MPFLAPISTDTQSRSGAGCEPTSLVIIAVRDPNLCLGLPSTHSI